MGGSQSSTSGQPTSMGRLDENRAIYKLVDMRGGGDLLPWFRYALTSGDHSFIDGYMETKVRDSLYNQGKGKVFTITELVKIRNKERNERLSVLSRKKGKGKSGPNVLDDFNQEGENVGDLKKALKLLDGGGKGGKTESKYRDLVWKLEDRGSMGETLLGICLLQGSDLHNKLVHKILEYYPKLINDVSISEDYYGLSPLHQAIINQDVHMVYSLLQKGADVKTRCFGAFFCAEDQKASRTDSLEHEYVELSMKTNYTGNMYFGEYPLSFAVCMNQPDCYRLLLAYKANPNAQDTNGNTVLHLAVIHENLQMLELALETGANLRLANKQNLTPLTLAAKLAKKEMFDRIMEIEGSSVWSYGDSSSTAYPLAKIDTISEVDGNINDESALSLIVYGDSDKHLDLLDGIVETVLEAKWEAFGRKKLTISFLAFVFYYILVVAAYSLRNISWSTEQETTGYISRTRNITEWYSNTTTPDYYWKGHWQPWDYSMSQCHLRDYWSPSQTLSSGYIRMGVEIAVLACIIFQLFHDMKDVRTIGWRKLWQNLKTFPAKVLYKISLLTILLVVPLRAACGVAPMFLVVDNVLSSMAVIFTTLHFLFYCRALKFVGPFVLMLYKIIASDIARFLMIYLLFLFGFSQSFFIVFLTCERSANMLQDDFDNNHTYLTVDEQYNLGNFSNCAQNPWEAFIRTFILTINEFSTLYSMLALCPSSSMVIIGKVVFVVFELGVSILQFNLLIAMMTRTYEVIFRTRKEYRRQWAQVILMLELSLSPAERLAYLLKYSLPTGTNKKQRSFVVNKKAEHKSFEEKDRMKEDRAKKINEERKLINKRRMKDFELREGYRPMTSFPKRPTTTYLNVDDKD